MFELDPEREVELPPKDVLGDRELPLFFGQREIYEVTRNKPQRLRLLDEIIGRMARKKQQDVHKLEEKLRRNACDLLDLEKRLTEKEETEHRLKEIEHKIEVYQREGLVEKLREATLLTQDEERLNQVSEMLKETSDAWQESAEKTEISLRRAVNQAEQAQSANKAILEEATQEIEVLVTHFTKPLPAKAGRFDDD
ncbi:MAG TPA: hypothetical protein EYP19_05150 [Desulfobacterales bacterium]|nr:hypothetical protein [Desulfobacterales bacterium]